MKKLFALILTAILCLSLFAGCTAPDNTEGDTRTVTDTWGREVEIPEKVETIVCLGSGAPRIAAYLGVTDRMVGAEDHDINGSKKVFESILHYFPRPFREPCSVFFPIRYSLNRGFFTTTVVSGNDLSCSSAFAVFLHLDSAENSGASAPPKKMPPSGGFFIGMVFGEGESNKINATVRGTVARRVGARRLPD